jgi:hypothetical protein
VLLLLLLFVFIPCIYTSKLTNVVSCEASQYLRIFRQNELAICGVPSIGEMCEDREGDCDSEEDEDGDEH